MNGTSKLVNSTTYVKTCHILEDQAEVITRFPTDESILVHVFALVFVVILIFTTVSLNAITVITVQRWRALKEKTSNFTILMQSIVDLANGILIMPLIVAHLASEVAGTPKCLTIYVLKKLAILMFLCSLTTLSVINFERYLGILHPFRHRTLVTNERLLAYVFGVCLMQGIIFGFSLTHKQIVRPVLITTASFFLLTTVFVYWKIFLTMRAKNRIGIIPTDTNSSQSIDRSKIVSEKRSKHAQLLKEIKVAKSSCLVVICCLICCVPATLAFGPLNLKGTFQAVALKIYFVALAMLNSTLNSIIYFWTNNMLRKLGMNMVRSIWKCM